MKTNKIFLFLLLVLLIQSCKKSSVEPEKTDNRDILEKLESLENIEVTEISPQNEYERQFEIYITQPLDHDNPYGSNFRQLIYLSHKDEISPVVFMPSGYTTNAYLTGELSSSLNANQLLVAHRFMDGAKPDNLDWHFLNIAQSSSDLHRIVEVFKPIYTGKWISYGSSKGGVEALCHRRHYPDDVLATVVKVAPLQLGTEDPRYDTFLENVGNEATRTKIKQFQRALLQNRDSILPMIRNYMDNEPNNLHYTRFTNEEIILEFEVCEYPHAFWQMTAGEISTIPDSNATPQELYQHLENFGGFPLYSDEWISYLEPCFYEFYTERGYYRLINNHLLDVLVAVPNISYSFFAPQNVPLVFKPEIIPDIIQWLQSEGNNIIYIYGEQDPKTAAAIELTGQTNAIKIIQPGANHNILISDLDEKDLIYSTLEAWLDIEVFEKRIYEPSVNRRLDTFGLNNHIGSIITQFKIY